MSSSIWGSNTHYGGTASIGASGNITGRTVENVRNASAHRATIIELQDALAPLNLANDGDVNERAYWATLGETFPNYERFWRNLVIPMTLRIELPVGAPDRHKRREGLADDLWRISYLNYSMFLNLAYASDHLPCPLNSSFGDFYAHLGTALDLAEDCLFAVYALVCTCRQQPDPFHPPLAKEDFITKVAEKWYDENYRELYEFYQKKGKTRPIFLPSRSSILKNYFGDDRTWSDYTKFAQGIRAYRNRIVHDAAQYTILTSAPDSHLVPRRERITYYRDMRSIEEAANDPERLKRDFIAREEQMSIDLRNIQTALNRIWEKPLTDLSALLYEDRNSTLIQKYNLT